MLAALAVVCVCVWSWFGVVGVFARCALLFVLVGDWCRKLM